MKQARLLTAVSLALLAGCASTASVDGEPVVDRKTIYISQGVTDLVLASAEPVTLEEDSRIYCSEMKPTGSHQKFTYCQTKAEFEERLELSQDFLRWELGIGFNH